MILLENIASVAIIAVALLGFGLWLAGVDPAPFNGQRHLGLMLVGLSFVLAILNAIVGDWSLAVAFALVGAVGTLILLAPNLPERLRGHTH